MNNDEHGETREGGSSELPLCLCLDVARYDEDDDDNDDDDGDKNKDDVDNTVAVLEFSGDRGPGDNISSAKLRFGVALCLLLSGRELKMAALKMWHFHQVLIKRMNAAALFALQLCTCVPLWCKILAEECVYQHSFYVCVQCNDNF